MWLEAIPAYGRDYKSQAQVREDWKSGKDFQDATSGQYLNIEDAKRFGLKVIVRYDKMQKVVNV
jgi:hypothetical protein